MIDNITALNERFKNAIEDIKDWADETFNETLTDQDDIDKALENLVLISSEAKAICLALTNHTIKFEKNEEDES